VSPRILSWLATQPDVRVLHLRSGSHPLARRLGAELADGEFLAFLDDDDEFLPDTLAAKVAYFRQHPDVDVLVTDGLRVNGNGISRIFPPPDARAPDLVETMMRAPWSACSLTLRADKVDLAVFDAELRHMEWTLTALLLARQGRVGYLDEPTFRYYETTPDSLSKTVAHSLAGPEVWRRLSDCYAGTRYEGAVKRRYGSMCHNASHQYVRLGQLGCAWRMHVKSLLAPGGVAYLAYSVRLAFASLRQLLA
jgi:glycosyltransferase involved in cell wall biosynthesis